MQSELNITSQGTAKNGLVWTPEYPAILEEVPIWSLFLVVVQPVVAAYSGFGPFLGILTHHLSNDAMYTDKVSLTYLIKVGSEIASSFHRLRLLLAEKKRRDRSDC